jgi:hypothetical protein
MSNSYSGPGRVAYGPAIWFSEGRSQGSCPTIGLIMLWLRRDVSWQAARVEMLWDGRVQS